MGDLAHHCPCAGREDFYGKRGIGITEPNHGGAALFVRLPVSRFLLMNYRAEYLGIISFHVPTG